RNTGPRVFRRGRLKVARRPGGSEWPARVSSRRVGATRLGSIRLVSSGLGAPPGGQGGRDDAAMVEPAALRYLEGRHGAGEEATRLQDVVRQRVPALRAE